MKDKFHILRQVAEEAEGCSNCQLASMILYKNKVVAIGTNLNKTHPFQAQYSKNEHAIFWHSETRAIFKAKSILGEKEFKKATLLVCRVKKNVSGDYEFGLAKPCEGCMMCIRDHGIGTVHYTMDCSYSGPFEFGTVSFL